MFYFWNLLHIVFSIIYGVLWRGVDNTAGVCIMTWHWWGKKICTCISNNYNLNYSYCMASPGHNGLHLFINILRPRQNGSHFSDNIFKCIKFVPKASISNIPALVQIMAWHQVGNKPLSEPMLGCSPTHICVSRPQWVNGMTQCLSSFVRQSLCWEYWCSQYL